MVILRLMKTQIPFKHQPQKMVKHNQIIRSQTGHFVELALKGLRSIRVIILSQTQTNLNCKNQLTPNQISS